MNMNDYQQAALKTARNKADKDELFHLLLGLCGEAGEIAEKMKKIVRDKNSDFANIDVEDMKKELGDVLWHLSTIGAYFDISLEDIAQSNIDKLASRHKRGVISGSGDDR